MVASDLKDYMVRERIGKGSFGEVFIVIHKPTRKKYVLKQVRLARQNEWQRAASHLEMQLAQKLKHPFIVPHVESWLDRGHTIHMVHQFCTHGDLHSLLPTLKGTLIPEQQLKIWLSQALLALEYCHSLGVVHRDLKTSNLFLNDKGDLLIGDFGLAAYRRGGKDEDHALVGTPHYMSPELLSYQKYSFETDIWSLGCCMWELSSHHPAFQAFNFNGLKNKILKAGPSAMPAQYSNEWGALLRAMLNKDPAKRARIADVFNHPCMTQAAIEAKMRARQVAAKMNMPPPPEPIDPNSKPKSAPGRFHRLSPSGADLIGLDSQPAIADELFNTSPGLTPENETMSTMMSTLDSQLDIADSNLAAAALDTDTGAQTRSTKTGSFKDFLQRGLRGKGGKGGKGKDGASKADMVRRTNSGTARASSHPLESSVGSVLSVPQKSVVQLGHGSGGDSEMIGSMDLAEYPNVGDFRHGSGSGNDGDLSKEDSESKELSARKPTLDPALESAIGLRRAPLQTADFKVSDLMNGGGFGAPLQGGRGDRGRSKGAAAGLRRASSVPLADDMPVAALASPTPKAEGHQVQRTRRSAITLQGTSPTPTPKTHTTGPPRVAFLAKKRQSEDAVSDGGRKGRDPSASKRNGKGSAKPGSARRASSASGRPVSSRAPSASSNAGTPTATSSQSKTRKPVSRKRPVSCTGIRTEPATPPEPSSARAAAPSPRARAPLSARGSLPAGQLIPDSPSGNLDYASGFSVDGWSGRLGAQMDSLRTTGSEYASEDGWWDGSGRRNGAVGGISPAGHPPFSGVRGWQDNDTDGYAHPSLNTMESTASSAALPPAFPRQANGMKRTPPRAPMPQRSSLRSTPESPVSDLLAGVDGDRWGGRGRSTLRTVSGLSPLHTTDMESVSESAAPPARPHAVAAAAYFAGAALELSQAVHECLQLMNTGRYVEAHDKLAHAHTRFQGNEEGGAMSMSGSLITGRSDGGKMGGGALSPLSVRTAQTGGADMGDPGLGLMARTGSRGPKEAGVDAWLDDCAASAPIPGTSGKLSPPGVSQSQRLPEEPPRRSSSKRPTSSSASLSGGKNGLTSAEKPAVDGTLEGGGKVGARVGDLVTLGDVHATVRYVGEVKGFQSGTWVGLELDQPRGPGNGTVGGVVYFECEANCGAFVLEKHLVPGD